VKGPVGQKQPKTASPPKRSASGSTTGRCRSDAEIFGRRVTKRIKGKLNTVIEQVEHGHHIYRSAFITQCEKFFTFLRNEVCSNNLADFGLKRNLNHLAAVREKLLAVTDPFATLQAQCVNVHVDFPSLKCLGCYRGPCRQL
jgi:hypothetical protein